MATTIEVDGRKGMEVYVITFTYVSKVLRASPLVFDNRKQANAMRGTMERMTDLYANVVLDVSYMELTGDKYV